MIDPSVAPHDKRQNEVETAASRRNAVASDSASTLEPESDARIATAVTSNPDDNFSDKPYVSIEASGRWAPLDLREMWAYRELLYFLTWRDIKIRYKQTVLGAAWAVLQPVVTMLVFSVFFGRLMGMDKRTDGTPYPVYTYAALLPWTYFANSITAGGNSLVTNANLISKVYFPRVLVPLSAVCVGLMDFAISFCVLLVLMLCFGTAFSWQLLLVPVLLLTIVMVASGVSLWLSALTVSYRDFRYVIGFLVQIWMFLSPVIYPASLVPERYRALAALNPMFGLIEGFRAVVLAHPLDWPRFALSLGMAVLIFVGGTFYFRKVERRFADII